MKQTTFIFVNQTLFPSIQREILEQSCKSNRINNFYGKNKVNNSSILLYISNTRALEFICEKMNHKIHRDCNTHI